MSAVRSLVDGRFQRTLRPWTPARWNEGFVDRRGYFRVYRPDYPRAWANGYAKRYAVVWWLKTGCAVAPGEDLHHKDENTLNDRFDNLEALPHAEHTRRHRLKPRPFLLCQNPTCSTVFLLPSGKSAKRRKFCSLGCRTRVRAQLSAKSIQAILRASSRGVSRAALARRFKVDWYVVHRILQSTKENACRSGL